MEARERQLMIIDSAISYWHTLTKPRFRVALDSEPFSRRSDLPCPIFRKSKLGKFFELQTFEIQIKSYCVLWSCEQAFSFSTEMVKCGEDFGETPQSTKPEPASTTTFFPPNLCRFPPTPKRYLNPGTISNLHKKTRDLMPEWIEGLSLRCARNLDVNKTFCAEWLMGNNTPVGFRFGGMLSRKDNDTITVSESV